MRRGLIGWATTGVGADSLREPAAALGEAPVAASAARTATVPTQAVGFQNKRVDMIPLHRHVVLTLARRTDRRL